MRTHARRGGSHGVVQALKNVPDGVLGIVQHTSAMKVRGVRRRW
ncbi:MAG: hypothetical protein AB7N53_13690 [Candidatus Binatia bacterium]